MSGHLNEISPSIKKVIGVIDRIPSEAKMIEICRGILRESTLFHACKIECPFNDQEEIRISTMMSQFILTPSNDLQGEIVFDHHREIFGTSIEYHEFASMFSRDFLYQNYSGNPTEMDDVRFGKFMNSYFVSILFRYKFCFSQYEFFQFSFITRFLDVLFSRKKLFDHSYESMLLLIVSALTDLEN